MRLVRKKYNRKYAAFILLFTAFSFYSCNNNPLASQNKKKMELEIIPYQEVSIKWNSTVYQHNSHWNSYLDTTAYDSLANLLRNSEILVEDMWCPNEDISCKIPYIPGMEVIVKLSKPDTSIYNYGFQDNTGGFSTDCFRVWRHYKYIIN